MKTYIYTDLENKPKRLLSNIPAQHLYLRMATDPDAISDQLEKIKTAELSHLFVVSGPKNAEKYLEIVSYSKYSTLLI